MTAEGTARTDPRSCAALRDLAHCRIVLLVHGADRTRIPLLVLWWLRWVVHHTDVRPEVVLLGPGPLAREFAALVPTHVVDATPGHARPDAELARVLGRPDPELRRRERAAREQVRALGRFDVAVLTSGMAGAGLDRLAERPPVVVAWVHLLGTSLEHLIGPEARRAMLSADWFVSVADAVSEALVGAYRIDRSRIVRHHGFIEPFAPDPDGAAAVRAEAGIPPGGLVLGGAGVQHWRKGPDLFVQVIDAVRRTHPDLDVHGLWVGGPDPEGHGAPIDADIERLGLADRVHILPAYDDPGRVLGAFDVFCLTSRDDPFPLTLLEAGWLGLPIVSFDTGGVRELGLRRDAGSLVNVVDYLEVDAFAATVADLLGDPARRGEEGERLRTWVRDHHLTEHGAPPLLADLCTMVHTTLNHLEQPDRPWRGATL